MNASSLPVLGFIGTGTISSALIKGLMRSGAPEHPIVVSPRSEKRAAELKALFPDRVTVAGSMQAVADAADWVFVAVLPKAAEEVYTSVRFKAAHKVVNLVMGVPLERICGWIGETALLAHIIPMVYVQDVPGPIVLYPPCREVKELLAPLGEVVEVSDRTDMETLQQITGLSASFFTVFRDVVRWGKAQGLSGETALAYSASFFSAMSAQCAIVSGQRVEELADEYTPGGLNWKGKTTLEQANAIAPWTEALDAIKAHSKR